MVKFYYCGFQFFFNLLLWIPIFYEFQKQIGLTDTEIFGIQSIYYLAFCFFEIPTGFLSDRFGHHKCMRFGAFTLTIANILPAVYPNYTGCLTHFLLIAISRSLISGAASAYLYEYFKSQGTPEEYKKIEGKARAYGLIGKILCWAFVGYLMQFNHFLPYYLTAFSSLIAFVFAFLLPALPLKNADFSNRESLAVSFYSSLRSLWQSPFLLLLMIQGVGIFVLARVCQVLLYQPILASKSFDISTYGWIMSLMTICEAFGAFKAHLLKRFVKDYSAIFIMTVVIALSLSFLVFASGFLVILSFCTFSLACGFAFPIQKQVLNDNISDTQSRATLLSIESIMDRLVAALVVWPMGGLITAGKLHVVLYSVSSVVIFLVTIVYILIRRKNN